MSRPSDNKKRKPLAKEAPPVPNASDVTILVIVGAILLAVVTCIAYIPAFQAGYVLDDDILITESPYIKAAGGLYDIWFTDKAVDYWPVTNTTFWIEWRLFGPTHPGGFHAVNIFLHIVESLLLWLIFRKLKIPGAYFAALLFAVHPVNVESVAWIASRKNLVAMLFMELSVLAYLRLELPEYVPPTKKQFNLWYGLSFFAFILAMLGKGSAISFPFILLLTIYWIRPLRRTDFLKMIPYVAAAVLFGVVNVWFQKHGTDIVFRDAGLAERTITAGYAVWFYVYKAFLPFNLALIYPIPAINVRNVLWYLPSVAVVLVSLVLFILQIRGVKRIRPFFFAWTFFVISLVPALGFVDVGFWRYSLVADRYQHLGLIAVVAIVAAGWKFIKDRSSPQLRFWTDAAASVVILLCAALAFQRCEPYKDSMVWNYAAIKGNPDCWMAYNNLANEIARANPAKAIPFYEKALKIRPNYDNARQNLGVAYAQTNQLKKAIVELKEAVRINPKYANAFVNLANAYYADKQYEEAVKNYEHALKLHENPTAQIYLCLSDAYGALGDLANAEKECKKAIELQADYANAFVSYGLVLNKKGQFDDAAKKFEKALELRPNDIRVLNLLAMTYAGESRSNDAIQKAEFALKVAKTQRDFQLAAQIDKWIEEYRLGLSKGVKIPSRDFFTPLK